LLGKVTIRHFIRPELRKYIPAVRKSFELRKRRIIKWKTEVTKKLEYIDKSLKEIDICVSDEGGKK